MLYMESFKISVDYIKYDVQPLNDGSFTIHLKEGNDFVLRPKISTGLELNWTGNNGDSTLLIKRIGFAIEMHGL
jgi:hypothetical protein